MALLDVDEVDTDVARAQRRGDVAILQPIELRIGHDPAVVAERGVVEEHHRRRVGPPA